SHAQVLPVTVTVNTVGDSATTADGDFQGITDLVLTFLPGTPLSQNVVVQVTGDTKAELDEIFTVVLSNPTNAKILDGEGVGTILNDDFPKVSINDVQIVEGHNGTVEAVLTVSLDQAPAQTLMVQIDTADGTARVADGDYQPVSGLI